MPRRSRTETILLELCYDGSGFHGVAAQPGLVTVEGELRALLSKAFGAPPRGLVFSARTDAGVSATQNFASFKLPGPGTAATLLPALARLTPSTAALRVLSARVVPRSMNARTCAREKVYRYRIFDCAEEPQFCRGQWEIFPALDVQRMNRAAQQLVGSYDFSSFQAANCGAKTAVREITQLSIERTEASVELTICGNGFLRKMVRIITGTLAEVGAGLRSEAQVPTIVQAKSRKAAGVTAPARGLHLCRVQLSQN